jgi:cation diffusion facilitator family transporter
LGTLRVSTIPSVIGVGVHGINRRYNSTKSHSHSHDHTNCDGHSHSHSHGGSTLDGIREKEVHHYYEYTPNQGTVKTTTYRDGRFLKPEEDTTPPRKPMGHGHSHAEYPEMDEMDFGGEEYTINVNPKNKSLWAKVKTFFNPHTPLSEMSEIMGSGSSTHTHTHATDAETLELYNPKNLANEGVKITWIGFGVNCGMAVTKFIGGLYFHSQALIADAVHAVGDLISDILTLTTVKFTNKKADSLYPYGYGKIETCGSFMVSFILLYAGFQIGWSSLYEILAPIVPNTVHDIISMIPVHSHSHGNLTETIHDSHDGHTHTEIANINAAWLALGSIIVKEWLFRATRKVGERLNSKVLIANAWHHRVDSLTSVVAVATISTGYFLNVFWLDAIGGLLVSMLIMKVGISGVFQSFKELIDKALPVTDLRYTKIEDSINVILMKKDNHVLIRDLSILPSGTNLNLVLKLGVSPFDKEYENKLTLDQMGNIAEYLKAELSKEFHNIKHTSVQFVSNGKSENEENDSKTESKAKSNEKSETV